MRLRFCMTNSINKYFCKTKSESKIYIVYKKTSIIHQKPVFFNMKYIITIQACSTQIVTLEVRNSNPTHTYL